MKRASYRPPFIFADFLIQHFYGEVYYENIIGETIFIAILLTRYLCFIELLLHMAETGNWDEKNYKTL